MDYYMERLPADESDDLHLTHWFAVLDHAVGIAARNHCGVKIMFYTDGDVVMTATNQVTFGNIREERQWLPTTAA